MAERRESTRLLAQRYPLRQKHLGLASGIPDPAIATPRVVRNRVFAGHFGRSSHIRSLRQA